MRGAQGLYDCIKEVVDDKRLLEGGCCAVLALGALCML